MKTEESEEKLTRAQAGNPFESLVDSMLDIENVRISKQIRKSHLARDKRVDAHTDWLLEELQGLEERIDKRIAGLLEEHPAYPWFSQVKGVGPENIAKVIGFIDIEKAPTISSLWKYCGMHVVDGKAPKPQQGQKLEYNKTLRTMCWRLATSLMKAKGLFFGYYLQEKQKYVERYRREGVKIVPSDELPTRVENGKRKKYEPEGTISEGHVHNQALRKMIKLFLACLWLEWRKAAELAVRSPYVIEKMGHTTFIDPQSMTDKKPKVRKRAAKS